MYFSERQLLMAIALAKFDINEEQIILAVTLDRIEEIKSSSIEKYLENVSTDKPIN